MIKILHTADWHLGHRLHGISRDYEHDAFLSWLIGQIEQTQADVLIIAGDIFDSANPSATAQSVYYNFLLEARKCSPSLDIIIIGGNHDSASRLDAPSEILQSLGVRVVGGLTFSTDGTIDWQRLVIPLTDKKGEVRAICGAMPFIRNADLPPMNNDEQVTDDPLIDGVSELYEQLFEQMQYFKEKWHEKSSRGKEKPAIGNIVTGHCYMVGTELSELSERRILGGNQHALPTSIFNEEVDYVALGHLHKAQKVSSSQSETIIRYSGSPIPLSFSERNYQHQIAHITLMSNRKSSNEVVINEEKRLIPRAIEVLCIPEQGFITLDELEGYLENKAFKFKEEDENSIAYPLLEIKLKLNKPEPGLRTQVETMLENLAVRLLKISIEYPGKGQALADKKQQTRLEELHPEEVFQQCYQRHFEQDSSEKITALFHQLLESVEESN
ncbi:MAG: exonuclease subunit SbcD [Gammaproteobacteria bacterium]|nr:exonuclease subunit SbcD [Gammaproteobacteria bacterium]